MSFKILIVGSFQPMALENAYVHNLRRLGHEIIEFETYNGFHDDLDSIKGKVIHKLSTKNIRKRINNELLKFCNTIKPSLLLCFKGADLYPETLKEVKSNGTLLVNYNPDHPLFFERNSAESKNIRESIPLFDLYLSYSVKVVEQLHQDFNIKSGHLPFGYDDRVLVKTISQFSQADAVIFVGGWDRNRSRFLNKLPENLNLKIYGNRDWEIRNFFNKVIKERYQNQYLVGADYANYARNTAGVINLLREQNLREQSHNMRTFEVPGYGGVLYSQRTEEQMSFFEEDKEAIYFDSNEELIDKMTFMKNHPLKGEEVKKRALQRSLNSGYSYFERAKQMSQMISDIY